MVENKKLDLMRRSREDRNMPLVLDNGVWVPKFMLDRRVAYLRERAAAVPTAAAVPATAVSSVPRQGEFDWGAKS